MDQQHINTALFQASLSHARALVDISGRLATLEAGKPSEAPSLSSSMERLAKLSTSLVAIITAIGKLWWPALVLIAATWKLLGPWVRYLLGFG